MLLTATALTTLTYCSDNTPTCRGFCASDATSGPTDAAVDHLLGFYPPDAALDAPTDAVADAADE